MVDTLIAFIRYFLGALKRLLQAAVIVALLLLLIRVLEAQPYASVAEFTKWITEFAAWVGGVIYGVACYFLDPWHAIIAIAIAWPLYHQVYAFNDAVGGKVSALKVAAFDLVRLMEITTDGNDAKATKLNDIYYKFAIEGPSRIAEAYRGPATTGNAPPAPDAPTSPSGGTHSYSPCAQAVIPPDLPANAYKLMERRLADMGTFGGGCGALRSGLIVFLLIVEHENISGAFAQLIEHMKKQADDPKLQNFVDLKRFFGLPTSVPKKGEPEELSSKGLSWYQYLVFEAALSEKNKKKIYGMMEYHPMTPDGKDPITIKGDKVLKSMRHYLYAWKNYDAKLAEDAAPAE